MPVNNELLALAKLDDFENDEFENAELVIEPDLKSALRNLLEEERRRAGGTDEEKKEELRALIRNRELELISDSLLQVFKNYITALPEEARTRKLVQGVIWMSTGYSLNGMKALNKNCQAGKASWTNWTPRFPTNS